MKFRFWEFINAKSVRLRSANVKNQQLNGFIVNLKSRHNPEVRWEEWKKKQKTKEITCENKAVQKNHQRINETMVEKDFLAIR